MVSLIYLERSRNLMVSLTDINARLASILKRIKHIEIDNDKMYAYLDTLVTHTVFPLLLPPSILREMLDNIERGMAQHPHLALPNDPNQDLWSYCKLLQINPVVFHDHLIIILQVPLLISHLL